MIDRLNNAFAFVYAFARTRWGLRFKSRGALLAYQNKRLRRFSARVLPKAPFYRGYTGQALSRVPVVNKDDMLAAFGELNTAGVSLADAQALALHAETERNFKATLPTGITVGLSSGTSGRRSVFLASDRERHIWAGIILARALSKPLLRQLVNPFMPPVRVAFFLRANSNLYETVDGARMKFRFFDLIAPVTAHQSTLNEYEPDILIAPPSVLHRLADFQREGILKLRPSQVISVAEVLEPDDGAAIEHAWGLRVKQIYQCTEGLLGYTCEAGSLHLNEEFVHIEPAWVDRENGRFEPIITDFTRSTQLFVRFRMDDVLRLDPKPCRCGRHSLRLAAIEGRRDDVLWLISRQGGRPVCVFPDSLRRAMLMAQTQFDDYRIEQRGSTLLIRLRSQKDLLLIEPAVRHELEQLWAALQVYAPALQFGRLAEAESTRKRRRIRCVEPPAAFATQSASLEEFTL